MYGRRTVFGGLNRDHADLVFFGVQRVVEVFPEGEVRQEAKPLRRVLRGGSHIGMSMICVE
jgi:hypothetical protein